MERAEGLVIIPPVKAAAIYSLKPVRLRRRSM